MTLALKVLAMFTLIMGILTFESVLYIFSWMPAYISLVTGVFIFLVNIRKIKKKYFDSFKKLHKHKFKSKGFIITRFSVRKRKILNIHRQSLKTVLFILCIGEVNLNLRQASREQMQHSNWNIA